VGAYLHERGKSRMALPAAGLYTRYRHLIPELLKFGVVGGIGAVIDLGGAAVLHGKYHVGPLEAKAISTTIATVVTYLGSRFWTFKHRENQALGREAALFIVLNVVGLVIAEVVIALVTYVFGLHSQLEYNAASVIGTGLATIFRYFAYRQLVFTAPAEQSVPASLAPELAPFPDYPPWEGDPAYLAAEVLAPASASAAPAGWDSSDAVPAPSWQSDPARSWQPTAELPSWEAPAEQPSWQPTAEMPSWEAPAEQPSWEAPAEHPSWEPASEVHSWGQSDERTQPRMQSSVISNEPVAPPLPPLPPTIGQGLIGGADPAASGSRGQGRHRRV
jgi:putative flippase GtrA